MAKTKDKVVTHQHSGDPAIENLRLKVKEEVVVTHQHSGDPAIRRSHR